MRFNPTKIILSSGFFILGMMLGNLVLSQSVFQAKVIDESYVGIAGAHVKNLRNNRYAVTNNSGDFFMECHQNDTLLVTAMGYDILTIEVNNYRSPYIKMKAVYFELKQVDVYELKSWASFKKDFATMEIPEQKVNVTGLPKGKQSKIPVHLRSDNFPSKPHVGNYIMNPFSSLAYYLNEEEKEKRKVWKMMQTETRQSSYWQVMHIDSLKMWLDIPDSLLNDYIVFCNTAIEDKNQQNEYYYKEKIITLYPIFIEKRP